LLAGSRLIGDRVTQQGVAIQMIGVTAGGVSAPLMKGGFLDQFSFQALFGDARAAGTLGLGVGLGFAGTK
jgi:hypothetical protein